ncbi:MAG: hypothetical protein WBZ36_27215 [Candidatus Nitrosopolaris sp.]
MPSRKIEVTAYECVKCSHQWINWTNGKEGPKPKRCSKCKRSNWEEGYLSRIERRLRLDLLKIEDNKIKYPTLIGDNYTNEYLRYFSKYIPKAHRRGTQDGS